MSAGIYLLHFERPVPWRPGNPPQHYLGRSKDVEARIETHTAGRGGRFTSSMLRAGIRFQVARRWPDNDYRTEIRLKGRRSCNSWSSKT